MNVIRDARLVTCSALSVLLGSAVASAQQPPQPAVARLVAEPAAINIQVGDSLPFRVIAYDSAGKVLPAATIRVGGPRRAVFFGDGYVRGFQAGLFTGIATWSGGPAGVPSITLNIPVTISYPPLNRIEIAAEPGRLYTDVTLAHSARGFHANGSERKGLAASWRSSNPAVATVDRFGNVTGLKAGTVTITASVEGVSSDLRHVVAVNPVTQIDMGIREQKIKTGDVVHLAATARRANGSPVPDAPITWSYTYVPDDSIVAPGASGIIDGKLFAANHAGRYTLLAHSGAAHGRTVLEVAPRDVRRRISITGRGNISSANTSDFWPWTGKDGRDYALVGTWGGDGWAIVYDITDMDNLVKTDSIKVDARTINDVTGRRIESTGW